MNYYSLIRKLLFSFEPETAHHITLEALSYAHKIGLTKIFRTLSAPRELMGLQFKNPIGLAAGLDKNGDYIEPLSSLGFGFVEIGTVTPKPQTGNLRPRLFRVTEYEALINRLGFNNKGLDYVEDRLQRLKYPDILGVNIGKNRDTSLEKAIDDYSLGFRRLSPYASYITINISSPNTPELRNLQQGDLLRSLIKSLKHTQLTQKKYVPLVVKIAPDLTYEELEVIADILMTEKIDGIIATNTTVSRDGIQGSHYAQEMGGLSGKPLFSPSTLIVKQLRSLLKNGIPIIACGGVFSAQDAIEKMAAGASLIQVYTGLIYRGPQLINELVRAVA